MHFERLGRMRKTDKGLKLLNLMFQPPKLQLFLQPKLEHRQTKVKLNIHGLINSRQLCCCDRLTLPGFIQGNIFFGEVHTLMLWKGICKCKYLFGVVMSNFVLAGDLLILCLGI